MKWRTIRCVFWCYRCQFFFWKTMRWVRWNRRNGKNEMYSLLHKPWCARCTHSHTPRVSVRWMLFGINAVSSSQFVNESNVKQVNMARKKHDLNSCEHDRKKNANNNKESHTYFCGHKQEHQFRTTVKCWWTQRKLIAIRYALHIAWFDHTYRACWTIEIHLTVINETKCLPWNSLCAC